MKKVEKNLKNLGFIHTIKGPKHSKLSFNISFKNIMQKWGLNRWNTCSPWGWVRIEFFLKVGSWIKLLHKYYIVATVLNFVCVCAAHQADPGSNIVAPIYAYFHFNTSAQWILS